MNSPELGPEVPQLSVLQMLLLTALIAFVLSIFCSPKG